MADGLPCARMISVRFKGTLSACAALALRGTPSGAAPCGGAGRILAGVWGRAMTSPYRPRAAWRGQKQQPLNVGIWLGREGPAKGRMQASLRLQMFGIACLYS